MKLSPGDFVFLTKDIIKTTDCVPSIVGYKDDVALVYDVKPNRVHIKPNDHGDIFSVPYTSIRYPRNTERDIRILFMIHLQKDNVKFIAKEYNYNGTRADIFTITDENMAIEYEIKTTGRYYHSESKNTIFIRGDKKISKHLALSTGKTCISRFYFLMPHHAHCQNDVRFAHAGVYHYKIIGGAVEFILHYPDMQLGQFALSLKDIDRATNSVSFRRDSTGVLRQKTQEVCPIFFY